MNAFLKDKTIEIKMPIDNDLSRGSMQWIRYVNSKKLLEAVKMSELG